MNVNFNFIVDKRFLVICLIRRNFIISSINSESTNDYIKGFADYVFNNHTNLYEKLKGMSLEDALNKENLTNDENHIIEELMHNTHFIALYDETLNHLQNTQNIWENNREKINQCLAREIHLNKEDTVDVCILHPAMTISKVINEENPVIVQGKVSYEQNSNPNDVLIQLIANYLAIIIKLPNNKTKLYSWSDAECIRETIIVLIIYKYIFPAIYGKRSPRLDKVLNSFNPYMQQIDRLLDEYKTENCINITEFTNAVILENDELLESRDRCERKIKIK